MNMKLLQKIGLGVFLIGLGLFCTLILLGNYKLNSKEFKSILDAKGIHSELFINSINTNLVDKEFTEPFSFSSTIITAVEESNKIHKKNREWKKIIWEKPHSLSYEIAKIAAKELLKKINLCFCS